MPAKDVAITAEFKVITSTVAPIKTAQINSITAPVTGEIPDPTAIGEGSSFNAGMFTVGPVIWTPDDSPFMAGVSYTATVILTATGGYAFDGIIAANTTINGKKAKIEGTPGTTLTLSYTFPATLAPIAIKTASINVTAPVVGAVPSSGATIASGTGFTISPVTWAPVHNQFQANTAYTATVTLTANSGYTFVGIIAGNTVINGKKAAIVSNDGTTLILSYVFTTN